MHLSAKASKVLLAVVLAAGLIGYGIQQRSAPHVRISDQKIRLEVVDTLERQKQGLSGRKSLDENQGMLFVFDPAQATCFWMKDMHFNIDIIWLDASKKVIHLQHDAAPASYPDSFCPSGPARYVVEVTAGTAKAASLRVGDRLDLKE